MKLGGIGLHKEFVKYTIREATVRSSYLHQLLSKALETLEKNVSSARETRLERLRQLHTFEGINENGSTVQLLSGGIDRDDPMLNYANLHQAAGLREE